MVLGFHVGAVAFCLVGGAKQSVEMYRNNNNSILFKDFFWKIVHQECITVIEFISQVENSFNIVGLYLR